MPRIFDRNDSDFEIYEKALKQWENSRYSEDRAMATNLRCDHRVSLDREKAFRDYFTPPYNGKALKIALTDYHKQKVRISPPAFKTDPIADYSSTPAYYCEGFTSQSDLVNVLNLNYLFKVLSWAQNSNRAEWKVIQDIPTNIGDYEGWLDLKLAGKNPDLPEIKEFIEAVFSLMNYNIKAKGPYNPSWVTTWDRFALYANARRSDGTYDADKWNQLVGVGTTGRKWQIVLRYPAEKAVRLYRPTQLDAGYHGYHFPSPPTASRAMGGHPMCLNSKLTNGDLFPEYVHEQISLDIRYWLNAGRLLGKTSRQKYTLSPLRRKHYNRLKSYYQNIDSWMSMP